MARKRFIAGATCPACGAQDRVYVLLNDDDQLISRHCVDCEFEEQVESMDENRPTDAVVQEWTPVRLTGLSNKPPASSGESSD